MHEASLLGGLKIVIILLFIYSSLKLLTRFFGPLLLKYITKKIHNQLGKHFRQFQEPINEEKGETTVNQKFKRKTSNKNVGEYIDYEEID